MSLIDDSTNEDLSWMLEAEAIMESENEKQNKSPPFPLKQNEPDEKPTSSVTPGTEDETSAETSERLLDKWQELNAQKEKNQELLRKLRLVKTHRQKNNLETLNGLTVKWTKACQDALEELHSYAPKNPSMTMMQLIYALGLDPKLVGFDISQGTFVQTSSLSPVKPS